MIHNTIFKNAFRDYLLSREHFSLDLLDSQVYLMDLLMVNVLDQIFVQTVFLPNFADIRDCLQFEVA
jgi:hypothetical protein